MAIPYADKLDNLWFLQNLPKIQYDQYYAAIRRDYAKHFCEKIVDILYSDESMKEPHDNTAKRM